MALVSEWRFGRGTRRAHGPTYVTVSTDIGGGLLIDGRQLIGQDCTAGEARPRHRANHGRGRGDGQPGHAEAIASGDWPDSPALEARALLARNGSRQLAELQGAGGRAWTRPMVGRAADAGDPASRAILARAWDAIGAACVS